MTSTVDLYRQILRDAYKVEDKKLARLVQRRLTPYPKTDRGSCNKIIPFPAVLIEAQISKSIDLYAKRGKMPPSS